MNFYFALMTALLPLLTVDFSPLMQLLTGLMPLILTLVFIGIIVGVLGKMGKLNFSIFLALIGIGLLAGGAMLGSVQVASATASLSPNTGTLIVGFPSAFTCDGLTADTAHHVNVTTAGTTTVSIAVVTSNSDGEISFSLVFTKAGSTTVTIGQGAGDGSGVLKATGQFDLQDMVNTLMLYIIFIVEVVVIFAVVGLIVGLFQKLK